MLDKINAPEGARMMREAARWLRRRAENVAAAMLAVMFVAFMVQIVFRYFFNFPIGWTSELTVVIWLWLVLWGAAFVVKEREEIRFDLICLRRRPPRAHRHGDRRALALSCSTASRCRPSVDYVTFMKVEKSSYLKIRLDWLFSIYVVFAVAVIVRYLWLLACWRRGDPPSEPAEPMTAGSGL